MSDAALNELADSLRTEWQKIVQVSATLEVDEIQAAANALSQVSRVGADSIKRKLLAAQYAFSQGMSLPVIVEMGQEAIVSSYNKSRKQAQAEQLVWLQWKVPGTLRDAMQDEQARIASVLKFGTSEQFFTWLHAQLSTLTDEELRHSAGGAFR